MIDAFAEYRRANVLTHQNARSLCVTSLRLPQTSTVIVGLWNIFDIRHRTPYPPLPHASLRTPWTARARTACAPHSVRRARARAMRSDAAMPALHTSGSRGCQPSSWLTSVSICCTIPDGVACGPHAVHTVWNHSDCGISVDGPPSCHNCRCDVRGEVDRLPQGHRLGGGQHGPCDLRRAARACRVRARTAWFVGGGVWWAQGREGGGATTATAGCARWRRRCGVADRRGPRRCSRSCA